MAAPERQARAVNPPGRPPEAPPPKGGPRAQGPLTPLTWRSDHVILRGGSPEDPPRRGHRPASPRALHVTHLALGARDPPGRPSPEDPPHLALGPRDPPGRLSPEEPPRQGHRPASPRPLHAPHLALRRRDALGEEGRRLRALDPLTWRPLIPSPGARSTWPIPGGPPEGRATGRPGGSRDLGAG